ncbi:site-specific DNA-methyltransferase [Heliophilum fasciatum]|uniref:Adenine specific DNA methylase Mod n=1 Tax=Heliophilum fasciatum TaxID=35700 RepID=A0A4V2SWJ2_9FIRM|nr:site-specific DNA-methyltransferase [Heliophilum fasciatum]MCW2278725.1 DNA modification methylase [Heliophilum fasciatum]TCP62536.1 adenine specific DNA methylase Mod [Heliophilum fasciatum]
MSNKVGISLIWDGKESGQRVLITPRKLTRGDSFGSVEYKDNLIVEGDNLHVMVSLLPKYKGKVQLIYIDPPYNTGNKDFRYKDDWNDEGPGEWVGEDDGGRHTKWIKFMYPRLKMLRRFLTQDGVIFVSIDDREIYRLGLLMDEVFGPQNKIGIMVYHSKKGGGSGESNIVTEHEYILCYARKIDKCNFKKREMEEYELNLSDEKGPYRRGRELNKWGAGSRREDRKTMWFPIPGPDGVDVWPIRNDGTEGRWRWKKDNLLKAVNNGDVEFVKRDNSTYVAYEKIRTNDKRYIPYRSILTEFGTNADGTKALKEIMGSKVFDTPKPVELIKYLIQIAGIDDGIVMDVFAGSGTTGQATLQLNSEDGGNRRFILVENGNGKDNFCLTLTAERIKRVITGEWAKGKVSPIPGGFTFKRITSKVDAEAILQMQREEIIELILDTDDLEGVKELPTNKYLFGKARNGRGIALVWNGKNSGMTSKDLDFIYEEAYKSECQGTVRIYAKSTTVAPDGISFEFQKIPDKILQRLKY